MPLSRQLKYLACLTFLLLAGCATDSSPGSNHNFSGSYGGVSGGAATDGNR